MMQRFDAGAEVHQEHITITRTARIALLGTASPDVRELWIACHGFGQLAHRFLRPFTAISAPHRLIVAPEALNRFYLDGRIGPHGPDSAVGATWMTREDRLTEIDDYVRYLDHVVEQLRSRLAPSAVRIVAVGFSQGVATICRWAARTDSPIHALVLWAGSLPPELEPRHSLFGLAKLILVAGDEDSFMSPAQHAAYAERLSAGGLDTVRHTYRGGHRIDRDALTALAQNLDFR